MVRKASNHKFPLLDLGFLCQHGLDAFLTRTVEKTDHLRRGRVETTANKPVIGTRGSILGGILWDGN